MSTRLREHDLPGQVGRAQNRHLPRDVGPRAANQERGVYWPWYLSGRAVRAKTRRQTNSRRHSKCPLLNHLRCADERRNELIAGNQNANTDPPEVPNKLINPTNSHRPIGSKSDLPPTRSEEHTSELQSLR